jgi:hypothetical protein
MVKDTDHRKRLIIELIKIKVKTGQPLDKILTKLTRDRYKHWNWHQVLIDIGRYYEELGATPEDIENVLKEIEQNY